VEQNYNLEFYGPSAGGHGRNEYKEHDQAYMVFET
jgi:hypothetical protein